MSKTRSNALELAQAGVIAALYVVLTLVFAPISFGSVQLRVAEALTILPLFTSAAVPGLFVGCLVANIFGGAVLWDIIFGSIATLIGAYFSYRLRANRWSVGMGMLLPCSFIFVSITDRLTHESAPGTNSP